ncbi:radical SAM protein [Roseiflexus sp.]|uniref:radical SAM protein n=1 Tax=Roseiflexus sp. TaxID=2562120 RepID=UPI00398ABFA4
MPLPPTLQLSQFCHWFEREQVVALFHTLHVQLAYLDKDNHASILRRLCSRNEICTATLLNEERSVIEQLMTLGMLVTSEEEDITLLNKVRDHHTGSVDISILYLLLTDQCNLACTYCFIEGAMPQQHHFSRMSPETAIAAIDLFSTQASRCDSPHHRPSIIFYGGEPTVNWDVLSTAVLHIEAKIGTGDLAPNTEISMITNGTLLNEERIQFLKEHHVGLSLSLDGPGRYNDSRPYLNGKQSTDRVMKSLHLVQQAEIPVTLSCTLNQHNIKDIREISRWMCDTGVHAVGFNMMMDVPGLAPVDEKLIDESVQALTDCYQIFRANGVYEDRIGRKVDCLVDQYVYPFDCGAYGGQMVVAPDGQIGVCHAYAGERSYFDKNVHNAIGFDPAQHPHFSEWSRRSPLNMPQCYDCAALGICGGGCAKSAEVRHGTIWALDDRFCKHAKHTLEWMIWDLYGIESIQHQ